jgi:hypothetical protein
MARLSKMFRAQVFRNMADKKNAEVAELCKRYGEGTIPLLGIRMRASNFCIVVESSVVDPDPH